MNDSVAGGMSSSVGGAAQHVGGGAYTPVTFVERMPSRRRDGLTEVRDVIRAQPITAALIVLGLGYVLGRLGALLPAKS